jgi:hypothetical protein
MKGADGVTPAESLLKGGRSQDWLPHIPRGASAALAALHLRHPNFENLAHLTDAEWLDALRFTDQSQLTLPLRSSARAAMPLWVRQRADACAARNREKQQRVQQLYRALDHSLRAAGVDYLALKGLAHCPEFGTDADGRVQYDIDLYTPGGQAHAAYHAVMGLGFTPIETHPAAASMEYLSTDHLPCLIRKTGWEWRGDFFDPEIPVAVEIHFRFWNQGLERLRAPGVEEFWPRRVTRQVAGVAMDALCPVDALAFACLHVLKHVLQGSARPFHIYEVARFLEAHAEDGEFWRQWQSLHAPRLRSLQAVIFRLAHDWFGCRVGPAAEAEMAGLPAPVRRWFERFAWSPAETVFHPAKHELWLHLSLLESPWDALAVTRRRLLPTSLPGPVDAVHIPESQLTRRRRWLKRTRYWRHLARRAALHAQTMPGILWNGVQWAFFRYY